MNPEQIIKKKPQRLAEACKSRGRPRKFNPEDVLAKAMTVFYEKGYEGTSLDDLTAAMGINRPSLYAAFVNKEALFLDVLRLYLEPSRQALRAILSEAIPVKEAMHKVLSLFVGILTDPPLECQNKMGGCLLVNSTILSCREPAVEAFLRESHDTNQQLIQDCLNSGRDKGQLPQDTDTLALSQFFYGVIQGMAVVARSQQSSSAVENMALMAMHAWPDG